MGPKQNWKAEKQPAWLVIAIKKTIAALPGGYSDAAEWLDVTENAIFNRLRADGDQIFPMGWALVLQRASGTTHIADAVSRHSNSVNVPLVDIGEVDNDVINNHLLDAITWMGKHSEKVKLAIADGVIDLAERESLEDDSHQVIAKWMEYNTLLYRYFCPPEEKVDARSVQLAGVGVKNNCVE
ncbi:DNA-binding protein [Budviciaceae bacterium BWR-B9]|uniref:DNA-binding protein n=1 Tax=Limnobaculum allomyrinae TaxID=2791986 RepID=A0ABS1IWF7_9GAMM|nr:YmfL family putative regulatory protein [Limnobaculum allomyrinae]MBK5146029.1 DNA-binding protein [Limnobaculum allomyrinae]